MGERKGSPRPYATCCFCFFFCFCFVCYCVVCAVQHAGGCWGQLLQNHNPNITAQDMQFNTQLANTPQRGFPANENRTYPGHHVSNSLLPVCTIHFILLARSALFSCRLTFHRIRDILHHLHPLPSLHTLCLVHQRQGPSVPQRQLVSRLPQRAQHALCLLHPRAHRGHPAALLCAMQGPVHLQQLAFEQGPSLLGRLQLLLLLCKAVGVCSFDELHGSGTVVQFLLQMLNMLLQCCCLE